MWEPEWSDDASLPCGYCVGWEGQGEDAYAVGIDGERIHVMYRFSHKACDNSVAAYVTEGERF